MCTIGIDISMKNDKEFVEFLQDEFQCELSMRTVFETLFEKRKTEKEVKYENTEDVIGEDGVDKSYICNYCGRLCKNLTSYKKHMTIMHSGKDEENVRCEECNKILKSMSGYLRHWAMAHQTKELSYECNQCDFRSAYEYKLKNHIKQEHEKRNEKRICTCGKSFSNKKQLGRHVREVHDGVTLKCDQCSYQTKRSRDLRNHIENKHGDGVQIDKQERPDIFCEFCGYSCKYRQSLQDHVEKIHLQNEYKCNEEDCDFVTTQKRKLQEHKSRHGEELICPICGKTFSSNKAWTKHKRETHKPKIERKCDYCDYSTISLKMLTKHLKWRHSEFSDKRYSNSKGFDWEGNREKWKIWKNFNNKYSKQKTCS